MTHKKVRGLLFPVGSLDSLRIRRWREPSLKENPVLLLLF